MRRAGSCRHLANDVSGNADNAHYVRLCQIKEDVKHSRHFGIAPPDRGGTYAADPTWLWARHCSDLLGEPFIPIAARRMVHRQESPTGPVPLRGFL